METRGNVPWQTRAAPQTDYERALADALEHILAETHDLDGIVAGLNAAGLRTPDGKAWTPDSFQAVIKRLGA
ncbi:MAG: recombinase-like helix-turn-helix domain-containing protein [Rhodospirillaceae bacterium]